VQLARPAAPKSVIVTGSVGSSTGAETCTSSASAERVSRKRRTVDLGGSKAGSWGCVGVDPALVPHAATLLGRAHQQSLAGVPKKLRF
jgi:hypothetical protein